MKCPSCGTNGAYVGLIDIDCMNSQCQHFVRGAPVETISHIDIALICARIGAGTLSAPHPKSHSLRVEFDGGKVILRHISGTDHVVLNQGDIEAALAHVQTNYSKYHKTAIYYIVVEEWQSVLRRWSTICECIEIKKELING